jgi:hypothetical protein
MMLSRAARFAASAATRVARASLTVPAGATASGRRTAITYSGGQATEGQGGYYGSGGARAGSSASVKHETEMLALAEDVRRITSAMSEVVSLERLLEEARAAGGDGAGVVTGRTIEIRSSIKKLVTSPEFTESLNRLEMEGEPIWGLSGEERDLIMDARRKVNDS